MDKILLDSLVAIIKKERVAVSENLGNAINELEVKFLEKLTPLLTTADSEKSLSDLREAIEDQVVEVRGDVLTHVEERFDILSKTIEQDVKAPLSESIESASKAVENMVEDFEKKLKSLDQSLSIKIDNSSQSVTKDCEEYTNTNIKEIAKGIITNLNKGIAQVTEEYHGKVDALKSSLEDSMLLAIQGAVSESADSLSSDIKLSNATNQEKLDELKDQLTEDVTKKLGEVVVAADAKVDEAIAAITSQTTKEMKSLVKDSIAQLEDIANSVKDGKDGIDRIAISPRSVRPGERLDMNEVVRHKGGLFQTVRKAIGNPEEDPLSYSPMVTGVADVAASYDKDVREYVLSCRLSDGELFEHRFADGPRQVKSLEPDHALVPGDTNISDTTLSTWDGLKWHSESLVGSEGPQGTRGRRGFKGEAGKDGTDGNDGVGIASINVRGSAVYITLTDDPDNEKFLIDMNVAAGMDNHAAIRKFAGDYHDSNSYEMGDVVKHIASQWLSLKDGQFPLNDKDAWVKIGGIVQTGGGGTVGSVSPVGSIIVVPENTFMEDWLLCDGSMIPTGRKYKDLRKLVGKHLPNLIESHGYEGEKCNFVPMIRGR